MGMDCSSDVRQRYWCFSSGLIYFPLCHLFVHAYVEIFVWGVEGVVLFCHFEELRWEATSVKYQAPVNTYRKRRYLFEDVRR